MYCKRRLEGLRIVLQYNYCIVTNSNGEQYGEQYGQRSTVNSKFRNFFLKNKIKSNKMGQKFGKKIDEIFENKIFVDKYDLIYWINGLALLMNAGT